MAYCLKEKEARETEKNDGKELVLKGKRKYYVNS